MVCHLDKGPSVSALPAEVSGGTIRSHPPEELVFSTGEQPARTNKLSAVAYRSFVSLVPMLSLWQ